MMTMGTVKDGVTKVIAIMLLRIEVALAISCPMEEGSCWSIKSRSLENRCNNLPTGVLSIQQ